MCTICFWYNYIDVDVQIVDGKYAFFENKYSIGSHPISVMQVFYPTTDSVLNSNLKVGALLISFKTNFISGFDSTTGTNNYFTIRAALAEGNVIASWLGLDVWWTEAMELLQSVASARGDFVWTSGMSGQL